MSSLEDDEELRAVLLASEAEYAAVQAARNNAASNVDEALARSLAEDDLLQLSTDEALARSLAERDDSQEFYTMNDEEIAHSLDGVHENQEEIDTTSDEVIARSLDDEDQRSDSIIDEEIAHALNDEDENDEQIARALAESFHDEEMEFLLLLLSGDGSPRVNTFDEEIARSLAGGGGGDYQEMDTINDEEMARRMYEAEANENGSEDLIARMIAENARHARQQVEPPPPPLEGGLAGLANHSQNVHASVVEQPAMRTMEELMEQPLPPAMGPQDMIREFHQQLSRHDLTRPPVELSQVVQQFALAVLTSPEQLQVRCNRSQRVFQEVLVAVWNVARVHKDKEELTRRLAEEVHEGVGQCSTGRITRLVNALRGFVDIGGQDVAQEDFSTVFARRVLNAGLTQEQKLAEGEKVCNEYGKMGADREVWLDALRDT